MYLGTRTQTHTQDLLAEKRKEYLPAGLNLYLE